MESRVLFSGSDVKGSGCGVDITVGVGSYEFSSKNDGSSRSGDTGGVSTRWFQSL